MSAASHLRVVPSDVSFMDLLDAPAVARPATVAPAAASAVPTATAKAKRLSVADELVRLADAREIKPLLIGTEPAAAVALTPGAEPVYRALTVDQFGVFLRRWHEEAGGGTVSRAALTQALDTLAARALGDAQAALPATPPQAPEPTAEEQAEEARSEAAVAALRSLVPLLRPAADNELVVAFLERRGLDPALITDLDLAGALPHVDVAAGFAEFAVGGADEGLPGNWWATKHLLVIPMYDAKGVVTSARARYCGTGPVKPAGKSITPKSCPCIGAWFACPRWMAWLRGDMPAPKTLVVCEGDVDFLTVATTIYRMGLGGSIGVVGIVSGSWTSDLSEVVPPETEVVLLNHSDRPGCNYRDTVARSLRKRAKLKVRHLFSSGDKLPDENDRLRELADKYDPFGGLHDWTAPPSIWPLSLTGNGERVAHHHGGDLRYCVETGTWLAWEAQRRRWLIGPAAHAEARLRTKEVARAICRDEDPGSPEARQELARWALISENPRALDDALKAAGDLRDLRVTPSDLDANPNLLGVKNGVLDLQAGKLVANPRAGFVTRHISAAFDPTAKCPTWDRALLEIFQGSTEIVEFFRRAVGYSLTGSKNKKLVFVCHGEGGDNGKSGLLSTLAKLFGRYGGVFRPELVADQGPGHRSFHTAGLEGLRFAAISELKPTARLSVDEVKRLAGGSDGISAEKKGKDDRTFPITWALWIALNRVPPLPSDDAPLLRRLMFIPFLRKFEKHEQDEELPKKWEAEFDGILAWAVRGYKAYLERGIDAPEAVLAHTEGVVDDADTVGRFVRDACVRAPGSRALSRDLYNAYRDWALGAAARTPVSETAFGRRLNALKIEKELDTLNRSVRVGVALAGVTAVTTGRSVDRMFDQLPS